MQEILIHNQQRLLQIHQDSDASLNLINYLHARVSHP